MTRSVIIYQLLLLTALYASASDGISIRLSGAGSFDGQVAEITVKIENKGSVPVYEVGLSVALDGESQSIPGPREILPGAAFKSTLTYSNAPAIPGLHHAKLISRYHDATGSPHSSVAVVPLLTAVMDHIPRFDLDDQRYVIRLRQGRNAVISDLPVIDDHTPQWQWLLPDAFSIQLNERQPGRFRIIMQSGARPGRYRGWAIGSTVVNNIHLSDAIPLYIIVTPDRSASLIAGMITMLACGLFVILLGCGLIRKDYPVSNPKLECYYDFCLLMAILAVIAWHIPPTAILRNQPVLGGDTPAHLYITAHLKEMLLQEGRITGWAPGWWSGFPLFRYYFPLPYLIAVAASFMLPINIAFRLVSVAGIFALPLTCYAAGRILRLRWPAPLFMALAALPVLFDSSHTMWGVNTYSTLAGMIANSHSFALLPLALAMTIRDVRDGRQRPLTIIVLLFLIMSHFFTSIIAAAALSSLLVTGSIHISIKRLRIMATIASLTALLSAWWWLPLIFEIHYSMEFGTNWEINLWRQLPWIARIAASTFPFAVVFCYRKAPDFIKVLATMVICALALFYAGSLISAVFVNIRLWPFIIWGLLTVMFLAIANLTQYSRYQRQCVLAMAIATLASCFIGTNHTRQWVEWNYRGAEQLAGYRLFMQMLSTVQNTPGRLAYEMHPHNQSLGSSRIFETSPLLANKPVIEGGLVNSALGALSGYYIQSLTSPAYAGLPPVVNPGTLDIDRASAYLELSGVSHFIARSAATRAGFDNHPRWNVTGDYGPWRIYKNNAEHIRHLHLITSAPQIVTVGGKDIKQAAMAWLETPEAINTPAILRLPHLPLPDDVMETISLEQYKSQLKRISQSSFSSDGSAQPRPPDVANETGSPMEGEAVPSRSPLQIRPPAQQLEGEPVVSRHALNAYDTKPVTDETITTHSIRFTTTAIGQPHLIKVSWAPGWRVRGASAVYPVTPLFMLVYPDQPQVELYYGFTMAARIGQFLFLCGSMAFAIMLTGYYCKKRRKQNERISS